MPRAAQIFRYTLPLCAPLILRGQTIAKRIGLLLRLEDETGAVGWGEAAPLPGFSREILLEARTALEFAVETWIDGMSPSTTTSPSAAFALQTAFANLCSNEGPDETVYINALLSGAESEILARASGLHVRGYRAAKLKVGRASPEADAALVRAVREVLHPAIRLRLDANRAWPLAQALRFAELVTDCAIEYIEEPVDDPERLAEWRAKTCIPYALDETLQEAAWGISGSAGIPAGKCPIEEARESRFAEAAAWIWKPTLVSEETLDWLRARGSQTPIILSAAHESGVGIAALARLAARYSTRGTPVGLDTYRGLAADALCAPLPMGGADAPLGLLLEAARHVDTAKLTLLWKNESL